MSWYDRIFDGQMEWEWDLAILVEFFFKFFIRFAQSYFYEHITKTASFSFDLLQLSDAVTWLVQMVAKLTLMLKWLCCQMQQASKVVFNAPLSIAIHRDHFSITGSHSI